MWFELLMQVVVAMFKNCPEQATQANVERIVNNPTWNERRRLRVAMRQEADKQIKAYLDDGDEALSSEDRTYVCAQICEKLGITHNH